MQNFKVGQKIRMKEDCSGCKKGEIYTLGINPFDRTLYAMPESDRYTCSCQNKWQLLKDISDISTYEVGDVLVQLDEEERIVLAICGNAFLPSGIRDKEAASAWFTPQEAIMQGWQFKYQPEEKLVEEMTLKEVCKELGREVKIIK